MNWIKGGILDPMNRNNYQNDQNRWVGFKSQSENIDLEGTLSQIERKSRK